MLDNLPNSPIATGNEGVGNTYRAADGAVSEEVSTAHDIERQRILVGPVTNLVQLLGARIWGVYVLTFVGIAQVGILTTVFWLATMRTYWNVPQVWYAIIASIGMLTNVIGLPAGVYLLLRRAK